MLQLLGLFGFVCLLGGCCAYFLLFLRRNKFETKLAYARAWTLSAVLDARLSETSRPICLLKAYQNVLLPFWAVRDAYILIRLLGSGQLPPFGIFWIASCILTISAFLFLRFFDILALAINIAALLLGAVCLFLPPPLSVMARPPIPAAICGALTALLFVGYCLRRKDLFVTPDLPELEDESYDANTLFDAAEGSDDGDTFFAPMWLEPEETKPSWPVESKMEPLGRRSDQPMQPQRTAKHTALRKRVYDSGQCAGHRHHAGRMKPFVHRNSRKYRRSKQSANQ